jgi:pimeloyl-ACP methyl ester carboxylesterase
MLTVEERDVAVDGLPIRYLSAGEGEPLVLLHGAGDNSLDWRWVLPALARTHRAYAPDLPGSDDSARPAVDYSSAFFERFLGGFVDALDLGRAASVGNSLGGLVALRLALSEPARVGSLVLVAGAGLGREVNPVFTSVNVPGLSEAAIPVWRTPVGAYQRAWAWATLLFARPWGAPRWWLARSSAGWRDRRVTSRPIWPRFAPWLARRVNARCSWTVSPSWRCRRSRCGESATGCSRSHRGGARPPASGKVPWSSSPTAATCPTSSVPTRSWQPSEGSSAERGRSLLGLQAIQHRTLAILRWRIVRWRSGRERGRRPLLEGGKP